MKPIDVKSDSYVEYNKGLNEKDLKFKIVDSVRISKYKNVSLKDTVRIGQKKFLLLVKLKMQFRGLMLLVT